MLLTEKEARGRMCVAKDPGVNHSTRCEASGCMCWRWLHEPVLIISQHQQQTARHLIEDGLALGFCGKGGRP